MQKPRRTSEFSEFRDDFYGAGAPAKRQTRQTLRQTVAPSPQISTSSKKFGNRQTYQRPTSLERERPTILTVPSSVSRTRFTTPIRQTPIKAGQSVQKRALFTADRVVGVPMHNDKKWVQEKMHHISTYLQEALTSNPIPSIGQDFFSRSSSLRHMSIKQFVAIINFFLNFIWRNRYTVGNNHVEDITNILQKLNYPHPVNKSWLMTPNTQHSFGHVIVLLDFLKDFAPPSESEMEALEKQPDVENPYEFELADEGPALTQDASNAGITSIVATLDAEFHAQMLLNAAEGFEFWDKQSMEEYINIQYHTCDILIQKRCNLTNSAALNAEIEHLQKEVDTLGTRLPPISQKDEELTKELTTQSQQLRSEIDDCQAELSEIEERYDNLQQEWLYSEKELKELRVLIARLQENVNNQNYNVQGRDQMIEDCEQLKHQLQVHERVRCDLQERNLNQQVMLSRAKKELTDSLEEYNTLMRDVCYSNLCSDEDVNELSLPLYPNYNDVLNRIQKLKQIRQKLDANHSILHKRRLNLDKQINDMSVVIKTKLQPELNAIKAHMIAYDQQVQQFVLNCKQQHVKWSLELQKLDEEDLAIRTELSQQQEEFEINKKRFEEIREYNEKIMLQAEKKQATVTSERHRYLDNYESKLDILESELKQLQTTVDRETLKFEELIRYKK